MKPLILTRGQWDKIRTQLQTEYPRSVFLLRERMKAKLGFTPRDHHQYDPNTRYYTDEVHLDFYSENKRTMFLMKFSEQLTHDHKGRV